MRSFGVTLAEFFTMLRLLHSSEVEDDDEISDIEDPQLPQPSNFPRNFKLDPDVRRHAIQRLPWRDRVGMHGAFSRFGTPIPDIWPVCSMIH